MLSNYRVVSLSKKKNNNNKKLQGGLHSVIMLISLLNHLRIRIVGILYFGCMIRIGLSWARFDTYKGWLCLLIGWTKNRLLLCSCMFLFLVVSVVWFEVSNWKWLDVDNSETCLLIYCFLNKISKLMAATKLIKEDNELISIWIVVWPASGEGFYAKFNFIETGKACIIRVLIKN